MCIGYTQILHHFTQGTGVSAAFGVPGGPARSHEYHGRTINGAFCSEAERLGCLYLLGLDFPKVADLAWVCLPFQVYQFRMPLPLPFKCMRAVL